MKQYFTRYRVVLLILLIIIVQAIGEWIAYQRNGGHFSYALDDAYIMMAISKNLAEYGVWGVTKYEFGATATSPLFTIILAFLFKIFGVHIIIPLLFNLCVAALLVYYADKKIVEFGISAGISKYILFLFIFLTPFFALLCGSMEHLLHLYALLWLLFASADIIAKSSVNNHELFNLLAAGFVAVSVRFESAFLVGFTALWLVWQSRWSSAVLLVLASAMPIVIHGIYSVYHGNYFLPNSVLLKGVFVNFLRDGSVISSLQQIVGKIFTSPWLATVLIVGYTTWVNYCKAKGIRHSRENYLILAIIFITICHLLFGWVGHVFRYEAYVIGSATLVICMIFVKHEGIQLLKDLAFKVSKSEDYFSMLLIAIMLYFPFSRGFYALAGPVKAKTNIYEQQVQMGQFIKEHYNHQSIGVSDIGAISFYADVKLLDFYGLASIEIAQAKLQGRYTLRFLDSLARARDMQMAVFFDKGLNRKYLPWYLVRRWYIQDNVVCGDDSVSFYAPTYRLAQVLDGKLQQYEPKLPPRVSIRKFDYTKHIAEQP